MIPPIAKFTIGMNTGLAVWVWVDVYKDLTRKNSNVSSGNLSINDHNGSNISR
jgi:hypothetical protein